MSEVIPFALESRALRVLLIGSEHWFVAADACAMLGIEWKGSGISGTLAKLDPDEKRVASITTSGGPQEVAVISESGLYTLILRSHDAMRPGTPAHRFRKWVTADVLPSLRRTGSYAATPKQAPTVPADQLSAAQAELMETQRKLIATQERLLAVTGKVKKSRAPKPITEEEIAEMRRLRATGLGCTEIGRRLGRNAGNVSNLTRDVKVQADLFGGGQ